MSTSWDDFTRLREQHPGELETIERIRLKIATGHGRKLSRDRWFDVAEPTSELEMLAILEELVGTGHLRRFVGVRSPFSDTIVAKFSSMLEVPPICEDEGQPFEVTFDNIEVFYEIPG